MNKITYIACSYQNRDKYLSLIESLKNYLQEQAWEVSIPVFDLSNIPATDYTQIMDKSFASLNKASLLIAEASEKNIGIGIEVGFAKALQIPIIYLYKSDAELSTTMAGTANLLVNYSNPQDAVNKINDYLLGRQ